MSRFQKLAVALLMLVLVTASVNEVTAQGVYYVRRPVVVSHYSTYYPAYSYPTYPTYYHGGWYPGSYQNLYGNYGAYHVMQPVWPGGYVYPY